MTIPCLAYGYLFLWLSYGYAGEVNNIRKWKKSIFSYLDREEKYSRNKIILSEEYFTLVQDNKESIEHWSNFKTVNIYETYVSMAGSTTYLIPKKCMADAEYDVLKEWISTKLK